MKGSSENVGSRDLLIHKRGDADPADRLPGKEHKEEDQEADILGNGSGQTCTVNSQVKSEHQDRISNHIQDTAGDQTDHGIKGSSLIAHNVIQDAGEGKGRAAEQDVKSVVYSEGKDGLGGAQQPHNRCDENQTCYGDQKGNGCSHVKADGGDPGGAFGISLAQLHTDNGAAAVTTHEADRLEDRLDAQKNTDGTGGGSAKLSHKVGVHQVVDHGDHHRDCGRNGKCRNQFWNWR